MSSCAVFLVSGPPASGKSSVSRALASRFERCALVSGDAVHHMVFSGRRPPWLDSEQSRLTLHNVLCLARNFVGAGFEVVVDYVLSPREAWWIGFGLGGLGCQVKYVVLMARPETLAARDAVRADQMGGRVFEAREEFLKMGDSPHILHTDGLSVEEAADTILREDRFILTI